MKVASGLSRLRCRGQHSHAQFVFLPMGSGASPVAEFQPTGCFIFGAANKEGQNEEPNSSSVFGTARLQPLPPEHPLSRRWCTPLGQGPHQPVQRARVDNAGRDAVTGEWRWEAPGSGRWVEGARSSAGGRRNYSIKNKQRFWQRREPRKLHAQHREKCQPRGRRGNSSKGRAFKFRGLAHLPHWDGSRDICQL